MRNRLDQALGIRMTRIAKYLGTSAHFHNLTHARLFNRATQPITLTPSGERFCPVAEDVLRRLYQGREDARRIGEISASTIRFAATHSLSLNFFPGWLRSIEMRSHSFNTRLDTVMI